MEVFKTARATDGPELRAHFETLAKIQASGEPIDLMRWEQMLDQIAMNIKTAGMCSYKAACFITVDQSNGFAVKINWYRDE